MSVMDAQRFRPKSRRTYLAIQPQQIDWTTSRPINFLWSEPPTVRQAVSISGDLTLFEPSDADVGVLQRDQFDPESGVWKPVHYRGKYLLETTYRANDELGYEVGPTTIWPIAGDEWIVFDDDGQLVHILTDPQFRRRYEPSPTVPKPEFKIRKMGGQIDPTRRRAPSLVTRYDQTGPQPASEPPAPDKAP